MVKSEKERVQQEVHQTEKDVEVLCERISSKKNELLRSMGKMEKIKAEGLWDSEGLKAWEESLKKRGDDNEFLQKLSKEDERTAKELEAKRENMQMEFAKRQQAVYKIVGEVANYELILERTGNKKVC